MLGACTPRVLLLEAMMLQYCGLALGGEQASSTGDSIGPPARPWMRADASTSTTTDGAKYASVPPPDLLWVASPTLPGQTVVAVFTGPAPNVTQPMVARLRPAVAGGAIVEPTVDAVDGLSAMFAVPPSWPLGVYEAQLCRAEDRSACSSWATVNDAEPLWAQGDRGAVVTRGPSGWLRVFGRALAFGSTRCVDVEATASTTTSSVRLVSTTSPHTRVILSYLARGSCYDLAAPVHVTVPKGRYTVQVKNGLPGSSWVPTSDSEPITVVDPEPVHSATFPVEGDTGREIAMALAVAGHSGGGKVELEPDKTYHMAVTDSLYIPNGVTLTTAQSASNQGSSSGGGGSGGGRALLLWDQAAPRNQKRWHGFCRGPGQQGGIWKGNLSARLDECPPLLWGNGSFTIDNIHARAPALSALVELVEPSFGAVVQNSVLEVVGYDKSNGKRNYVNVSNVLHIGNCTGFSVKHNELRHVPEGAVAFGGQYGGGDTPAPCGQNSPDNYAFFFDQGVENGAVMNNSITMGCNGWGTQSHANLLVEDNIFQSVGRSGVEGSGFSSASTVPRATQAAFLRNTVRGTNAATGPHLTEWCNTTVPGIGTSGYNGWCNRTGWGPKAHPGNPLETMTSDGSYGGYFGAAVSRQSDMSIIALASDIVPNSEGGHGLSPDQQAGGVQSWRHAAMVVVQGQGLGQVRTVVGAGAEHSMRLVQLDRPLSTPLGSDSVITIAPNVGRWIVAGNEFSNGTSVQTYGISLQAVFANNSFINMTKSSQVDPAGLCLTSLGYGTGTMPNMYIEITGNRQSFSEGIHMRCNLVNDTALTYGFAIRDNSLENPPPPEYFGTTEYPDLGLGPESGGQITVSATCTAGLVEGNIVEDRRGNGSQAIKVNEDARTVVARGNHVK